jgi:hypothetical protein
VVLHQKSQIDGLRAMDMGLQPRRPESHLSESGESAQRLFELEHNANASTTSNIEP